MLVQADSDRTVYVGGARVSATPVHRLSTSLLYLPSYTLTDGRAAVHPSSRPLKGWPDQTPHVAGDIPTIRRLLDDCT